MQHVPYEEYISGWIYITPKNIKNGYNGTLHKKLETKCIWKLESHLISSKIREQVSE